MSDPFRSRCGAAMVLALGLAVPLTALGRGVVPAAADPATDTTTTTTTTLTPVTTTYSVLTTTTAIPTPTTTTSDPTSSTTSTTTITSTSSPVASSASTSVSLIPTSTTTPSDAVSSTPSPVIPTAVPQTLTADPNGIQRAQAAPQTRQDPALAAEDDVRLLTLASNRSNRKVLQWDQGWITYDNFYRPVIINPFGTALHIFWRIAGGVIQEIVIPAFGRILTEVSQPGPNPVTAILPSETGEPDKVTAGVINGGGRDPGPDRPPPLPPPAPTEYPNACVAVHYSNAQYKPFIVRKVVDVGDDAQYGEHKVLLDGVTPAWGAWAQSADCGTQFEVHKTQLLPGVDEPKQAPLPGGYPMQLASYSSSSGFSVFAVRAALIIAVMILGAVLVAITRAKKDPLPDQDDSNRHGADARGRTQSGHPHTRVRAVARPGRPPVVTAHEVPATGGPIHAIRLEAHFDPGSPTIREVDDDIGRIE